MFAGGNQPFRHLLEMFVAVSLAAVLEVDALFVVVILRDLVWLFDACVLGAPCLAKATMSPE